MKFIIHCNNITSGKSSIVENTTITDNIELKNDCSDY